MREKVTAPKRKLYSSDIYFSSSFFVLSFAKRKSVSPVRIPLFPKASPKGRINIHEIWLGKE